MIVVVTGATGNLGPAVVAAFRARGDTVVEVSRRVADMTSADDANRAIDDIAREHGRIDVLAHVMGGFAGGEAVDATSDETWSHMMAINLHAAFFTIRAVLAHMRAAGAGRIIAVSSRASQTLPAGLSAYNVSKAGLNALIQTIAAEVKDTGITANAVLPTVIDREKGVAPEAIADLIVWLTSDAAKHVNGALLPIGR